MVLDVLFLSLVTAVETMVAETNGATLIWRRSHGLEALAVLPIVAAAEPGHARLG